MVVIKAQWVGVLFAPLFAAHKAEVVVHMELLAGAALFLVGQSPVGLQYLYRVAVKGFWGRGSSEETLGVVWGVGRAAVVEQPKLRFLSMLHIFVSVSRQTSM